MLWVVQHVRSPRGKAGVNAYCYRHAPLEPWPRSPAVIDRLALQLDDSDLEVRGSGNTILAYLDVLARSKHDVATVIAELDELAQGSSPPPAAGVLRRSGALYRCEFGAPRSWRRVLGALTDCLLLVP